MDYAPLDYATLNARHQSTRDQQHPNLSLRVHRALSWLRRAEQAEDDDGKFIFLWIAFNAAYATEIDEQHRLAEQHSFNLFLEKLCKLDTQKRLHTLVWQTFSGPIRVLLDNPYVFQSFWDWHNGKISEAQWKASFENGKNRAKRALASGDTAKLLAIVFNRIYTLRNQLMHGGATWNSSVNRQQVRDSANFMGQLVPLLIELMMDNPNTLWGDAYYPVVQ